MIFDVLKISRASIFWVGMLLASSVSLFATYPILLRIQSESRGRDFEMLLLFVIWIFGFLGITIFYLGGARWRKSTAATVSGWTALILYLDFSPDDDCSYLGCTFFDSEHGALSFGSLICCAAIFLLGSTYRFIGNNLRMYLSDINEVAGSLWLIAFMYAVIRIFT